MPIASFGSKTFVVSSSQLSTFDNLKLSAQLRTESKDVTGGKPTTTIKGPGLEELSFNIPLDSRFVDVRKECDSWRTIRDAGVPYLFVLGEKPIVMNKFLLTSVDISYESINGKGGVYSAGISLKFTEYLQASAKKSSKKSKKTNKTNKVDTILTVADKNEKVRDNQNKAAAVSSGTQPASTQYNIMQKRLQVDDY